MIVFVGFVTMIRAQFYLIIQLESSEEFKAQYDYSSGIFCHALAIVNKFNANHFASCLSVPSYITLYIL